MKLNKSYFLGSLTALLFTQSVFANQPLPRAVDVQAEVQALLAQSLADIEKPDVTADISKVLHKRSIELATNELVAQAGKSLPVNRFKVVIAE